MRINILHNKIVMDTVTNKFLESFTSALVPMLEGRFGTLESVTVYEDYLSDGFLTDGVFRLPLTIVNSEGVKRVFCSWRVDKKNFEDMIPYSYKGAAPIEFKIEESGCAGLSARLEGRALLPKAGAIRLNIDAASRDKTFLSGKYSQSFVDLMAYEITRAIEKEFSISKAADSSLELHLSFAPGTFMEHAADSSSYRRLRISARSCGKRDLWIKWTRLDGNGTYTVGDHVGESDIRFEIADNVPQKIREKEYRYLMATESSEAYRAAMSRKNFMEWRELVKRVIKRGEVTEGNAGEDAVAESVESTTAESRTPVFDLPKIEIESPGSEEAPTVQSIDLQALLDNYSDDSNEPEAEEEEINPDLQALLLSVINRQNGADSAPEEKKKEDEPPFDIDGVAIDPLSILTELGASAGNESVDEEKILPEYQIISDHEDEEPNEEEPEATAEPEEIEQTQPVFQHKNTPAPISRVTLDDFGYDERRQKELDELRSERDELREALDALKTLMQARDAEMEKLRESLAERESGVEELKTEISMLREELMAKRREEDREKDRIASMARLAVESQAYTSAFDDEAAGAAREKEEKCLEEERISRERAEKERLVREKEEQSRQKESEARKPAEEKEAAAKAVRYVSKTADMFFRYPVDPNITKRIQDIIVSTVKYFEKENVYMKVKATIPESKMVKLEFLEIPEDELTLLTDIIRVLGHSKIGITRVLLD